MGESQREVIPLEALEALPPRTARERALGAAHVQGRRPPWLKAPLPGGPAYARVRELMQGLELHSVCQEAHCPNLGECWSHGTATFMILGRICTRACGFCAVETGRPTELDTEEPSRVAEAVRQMGLRHVVITSVARDELPDGGASGFVATIAEVRRLCPDTRIEVLVPDFGGQLDSLSCVLEARPDILNHNIETCRRLTPRVRARARYERTLELLGRASRLGHPAQLTKSGFMVGLGESWEECLEILDDLRAAGVQIVTIGQYLRPSPTHLPLVRYYTPDEFGLLRQAALARGFAHCESGPLVRSSYHAHTQVPPGMRAR